MQKKEEERSGGFQLTFIISLVFIFIIIQSGFFWIFTFTGLPRTVPLFSLGETWQFSSTRDCTARGVNLSKVTFLLEINFPKVNLLVKITLNRSEKKVLPRYISEEVYDGLPMI